MIYNESSENALYVFGYKNGIMKKYHIILLISTQQFYFCDDDTIYDIIFQEPFWKWHHNTDNNEISRDPFAELHCTTPLDILNHFNL